MRRFTTLAVLLGSILIVPLSALAATEISDGSVKGLYHLEDEVDSSGNGHTLTNTGSVTFPAGLLDNGASFSGSNDLSNSTADAFFTTWANQLSLSAWVKFTDVTASNYMVLAQDASDYSGPQLRYRNISGHKKFIFEIDSNLSSLMVTTYQDGIVNGQWYHIVVTYDGGSDVSGLKIYFDGVLQTPNETSNTSLGTFSTMSLVLGASNAGGDPRHFSGMLDEVVLTNAVISSSTVTSLWNGGSGSEVCITSGCGGSTPTSTPTSTASTSLNASDALDWLLFFIIEFVFTLSIVGLFVILIARIFNI
jgi:hypothetical protein